MKIVIPNSVTSIGSAAFRYCLKMGNITIPESVTSIGANAFEYCSMLSAVVAEGETPAIASENSFANIAANALLIVPAGSKEAYAAAAGWNTFSRIYEKGKLAYNVTDSVNRTAEVSPTGVVGFHSGDIVIPSTVVIDGIEYTVTAIGEDAFASCRELTSVSLPESVTTIGTRAFMNCSALTSLEVPDNVVTIGISAFANCTSLTSVKIGRGVAVIGLAFSNPFLGCSSLESVIVDSNNATFDSRDNCNAIIVTETNVLLTGCKNTVIPSTVTSIGSSAFFGCSGLTSIEVPSSVTSIGGSAFCYCSGLTEITLNEGLNDIRSFAFDYCSNLKSIHIPASVTVIVTPFSAISSMETITVAEGNTVYDSRDNCNAIIKTATNTLFMGCKTTVIPNTVTAIGSNAFIENSELENIAIPEGVTTIGSGAFEKCSKLDNVILPSTLTSIGEGSFSLCKALNSIVIPKSVASIKLRAFYDCANLTSVTFLGSATSIGDHAFSYETSLKKVIVESKTPPVATEYAFSDIPADATLYVPAGTKEAYASATGWNTFANISEIVIGDANYDNVVDESDAKIIAEQIAQSVQEGHTGNIVTDMNADGETNVVDVVATINSIIGTKAETMSARSRTISADCLSMETFDISAGEIKEVEIVLNNVTAYTAFQADVCLPAGLVFVAGEEAVLDTRATASHVMTTAVSGENMLRMVSYSTQSENFAGTEGTLVKVKVTASEDFVGGEMSLKNIVFATANEEGVNMDDISVNVLRATGIGNVTVVEPVEYYNLQGVKVENPQQGIYIKKQGVRTSKVVLK